MKVDRTGSLQFPQKNPNRILTTGDICLKRRSFPNKPKYAYDISDIEGAHPKPKGHFGNRQTNPLEPVYQYPSVPLSVLNQRLNTPPKPGRNTLNISDIEGCQPKKSIQSQCQTSKNIMYHGDIEGSCPGWKMNHRKWSTNVSLVYPPKMCLPHIYYGVSLFKNSLNVRDINNDQNGCNYFRSSRCTNPLEPVYQYDNYRKTSLTRGKNIGSKPIASVNIIGPVEGSRANKSERMRGHNKIFTSLKTDDVAGAVANPIKWKRDNPKDPNFISDIAGTQPWTKKMFRTHRHLNPLDPKYTLPTSPSQNQANAHIAQETLRQTQREAPRRYATLNWLFQKPFSNTPQRFHKAPRKLKSFEKYQQEQLQAEISNVRSLP
ncbi:hypothetical protein RFI_02799 [Reticulomyxa filosa]|uniref:Uncharacterized protein n=1 Tax=Reticulomyxa filosa TaxID=46433 RepID=X6P857_RETFI|nr:hypothetical protein RFI_02799 [Reticulomyxa filosa]|eukprot:ETO34298.1 hypothetical protein RFI_02799 [Reticulomyxa filosa]